MLCFAYGKRYPVNMVTLHFEKETELIYMGVDEAEAVRQANAAADRYTCVVVKAFGGGVLYHSVYEDTLIDRTRPNGNPPA